MDVPFGETQALRLYIKSGLACCYSPITDCSEPARVRVDEGVLMMMMMLLLFLLYPHYLSIARRTLVLRRRRRGAVVWLPWRWSEEMEGRLGNCCNPDVSG